MKKNKRVFEINNNAVRSFIIALASMIVAAFAYFIIQPSTISFMVIVLGIIVASTKAIECVDIMAVSKQNIK